MANISSAQGTAIITATNPEGISLLINNLHKMGINSDYYVEFIDYESLKKHQILLNQIEDINDYETVEHILKENPKTTIYKFDIVGSGRWNFRQTLHQKHKELKNIPDIENQLREANIQVIYNYYDEDSSTGWLVKEVTMYDFRHKELLIEEMYLEEIECTSDNLKEIYKYEELYSYSTFGLKNFVKDMNPNINNMSLCQNIDKFQRKINRMYQDIYGETPNEYNCIWGIDDLLDELETNEAVMNQLIKNIFN